MGTEEIMLRKQMRELTLFSQALTCATLLVLLVLVLREKKIA